MPKVTLINGHDARLAHEARAVYPGCATSNGQMQVEQLNSARPRLFEHSPVGRYTDLKAWV